MFTPSPPLCPKQKNSKILKTKQQQMCVCCNTNLQLDLVWVFIFRRKARAIIFATSKKITRLYSCSCRHLRGQRLRSEQLDSGEKRQQQAAVVKVHIHKDTDKKFTVPRDLGSGGCGRGRGRVWISWCPGHGSKVVTLVSDPYLSKSHAYCCPEQHLGLQLSHQLRGSEPYRNVDTRQVQGPRMDVRDIGFEGRQ